MHNKIVYISMVGDMLHAGHINIVEKARNLGRVVVGVITDTAATTYKRLPFMPYDDRVRVISSLAGVDKIIPQDSLSYRANLELVRPDYVVHGDDWQYGDMVSAARREVIEILSQWGGELIEVPYTLGISSTLLHQALEERGIMARTRQARFRHLLDVKPLVRIIEAHSGLSAVISHRTRVAERRFDALWQSSLTDATMRAKPDIEIVDAGSRLATVNEIFDAVPLPLIYDGDTGGTSERVYHLARSLDRAGVSALCLEDKEGAKRNSLYGTAAGQRQAPIEEYKERIFAAKEATAAGLMFIARIESFILGAGLSDGVARAEAYIDAGADAILIHSIAANPSEVLSFSKIIRANGIMTPIIVVPTTYGSTHEDEFVGGGINAVIYANHLLRAAYPHMVQTARHILENGRSDDDWTRDVLADVKDLLSLIPTSH